MKLWLPLNGYHSLSLSNHLDLSLILYRSKNLRFQMWNVKGPVWAHILPQKWILFLTILPNFLLSSFLVFGQDLGRYPAFSPGLVILWIGYARKTLSLHAVELAVASSCLFQVSFTETLARLVSNTTKDLVFSLAHLVAPMCFLRSTV